MNVPTAAPASSWPSTWSPSERSAAWLASSLISSPMALWIVAGLHACWGLMVSLLTYHKLHMFTWDIGVMTQVAWNTAHGRWFESSVEINNFLGDHFTPMLGLLGFLHYIVPLPYSLLIVQQISSSISGAMIGTMVRHKSGSARLGWAAAILVWCHPSTIDVAMRDFQVLTLALPLSIALYWLVERERYINALSAGLLLLSVRQDGGIAMMAVGLILLFHPQQRKAGIMIATAGGAYTLLATFFIIPYFRAGQLPYIFQGRFRTVDNEGGLTSFIDHIILGERQWRYIFNLLLSMLFLPLLFGWRSLILLFSIGHLLLIPSTLYLDRHYSTIPLVVMAILLINLFSEISFSTRLSAGRKKFYYGWIGLAVVFSLGSFLWRDVRMRLWLFKPEPRVAQFREVASFLPPDASVAASLTAGSHLFGRDQLYLWPEEEFLKMLQPPDHLRKVDYILTDAYRERHWKREHRIQELYQDPRWELVHASGDFALFKRAWNVPESGHVQSAVDIDHLSGDE